jgi:hypothetical protein
MGHHVRPLVLVLLFAAAAMATSEVETTPPIPDQIAIPPLPSPADIPVTPPCLNSITVCGAVYGDPSKLAPCCVAVKKLFKSDPKCICNAVSEAQKFAKKWGGQRHRRRPGDVPAVPDAYHQLRPRKTRSERCIHLFVQMSKYILTIAI